MTLNELFARFDKLAAVSKNIWQLRDRPDVNSDLPNMLSDFTSFLSKRTPLRGLSYLCTVNVCIARLYSPIHLLLSQSHSSSLSRDRILSHAVDTDSLLCSDPPHYVALI